MDTVLSKTENKIWDIPAVNLRDDTVEKYDYVTVYEDTHGAGSLSNADQFSFTTNNEDIWYVPGQSYLLVTVKVTKADGTEYDWEGDPTAGVPRPPDNVSLCDNGYNVFSEGRYYIDDKEVERIDYLGIASAINQFTQVTDRTEKESLKHSQLWFLNDETERKKYINECSGIVQLLLPLDKIFPFCSQVDHAFRGSKHRITFRLNDSTPLIKRGTGVTDGKVVVQKMEWKVPHVEPSLEMMTKMEGLMAKDSQFKVNWDAVNVYRIQPAKTKEIRTSLSSTIHKPTHVFIGFQNLTKYTSQKEDCMHFNDLEVEGWQMEVNSVRFPDQEENSKWKNRSGYIEMYQRFLEACKGRKSQVDYDLFREYYPILHVDVSKHKSQLFENTSFPNIVVNVKFRKEPAFDYIMWVVVYNEREAVLNLEQKKMRVIR